MGVGRPINLAAGLKIASVVQSVINGMFRKRKYNYDLCSFYVKKINYRTALYSNVAIELLYFKQIPTWHGLHKGYNN